MNNSEIDLERIHNALSSKYHCWIVNTKKTDYSSLRTLLAEKLTYIQDNEWDERIAYGGVYINGINAKESEHIPTPAKVEYYEPKLSLEHNDSFYSSSFSPDTHIVYEDEYLLAVYKPASLHVLPAKEQQHINLKVLLHAYAESNLHFPSRLDFSTEGLLMCSKNPSTHSALQQLFEKRDIKKTYYAKVGTCPPWHTCTYSNYIARDQRHHVLRKVSHKEGKYAITEFEVLNREHAIIKASPHTGRTHQIRVHLSSLGYPIVGDNFYAGKPASSLHLLSYGLEFLHPIHEKVMNISVPEKLLPVWMTAASGFA